tara:strand:- start:527 stop:1696 length:1170 start_codon:yes stop_codon:yes gene_type:complete
VINSKLLINVRIVFIKIFYKIKYYYRNIELIYWRKISDKLYNQKSTYSISTNFYNKNGEKGNNKSNKWLNHNLVIYLSSRNNYDLMRGEFVKKVDTQGFKIINVDDGSTKDERIKGEKLCVENNIIFLNNSGKGIQWATQTAINYLSGLGSKCEWLIHFTHDNFPISANFFKMISKLIISKDINDYGCIGFNHMELTKTLDSFKEWNKGINACGLLGLGRLTKMPDRNPYLGGSKTISWDWNTWGSPFLVESVLTPSFGININLFKKYIEVTDDFRLFFWSDDVCFQFLLNGINNLVIPELVTINRQDVKEKYSVPVKSARTIGTSTGNYYFSSHVDHHENWKRKWGWHLNDRNSFLPVRKRYKDTLLDKFFFHDIMSGPFKSYSDIQL